MIRWMLCSVSRGASLNQSATYLRQTDVAELLASIPPSFSRIRLGWETRESHGIRLVTGLDSAVIDSCTLLITHVLSLFDDSMNLFGKHEREATGNRKVLWKRSRLDSDITMDRSWFGTCFLSVNLAAHPCAQPIGLSHVSHDGVS